MIATANIFSTVYRFTALLTMAKEYNYRYLLVDGYDTSSDKFQPTHRGRYRGWFVEYRNILAVSILLFISLAINVFLFVKNINKPGLEESGQSLYSICSVA
jgi:large-conductance mechanosensitive channel